MSFRGRAVRGASRATAVIGVWLVATCCFTRLSSGLEALTVSPSGDEWTAELQAAAAPTQQVVTELRIVLDGWEPAAAPAAVVSHSTAVPPENGENLRLQWQIGPSSEVAPPSRDGASAPRAAAAANAGNGGLATNEGADLLEALKRIPVPQKTSDRPLLYAPNEAPETRVALKPRALPPIADAGEEPARRPPTTPITPEEYSLPPRELSPPEPTRLADQPAARLALQPTIEDRENEPSTQSETMPPPPATGEPAFQSAADLPAANGAEPGEDTIAGAERLGEEPVDNRLQFLRDETVLLEPGQWQWDVGLIYVNQQNNLPIVFVDGAGNVTDVQEGQIRTRQLFIPFGARYGLNRRTQLFFELPIGWANSELSTFGSDEFDHDGPIGDITLGFTHLLASNDCRDVVFTLAATAPTGGDPYDDDLAFPAASLGQGFWALSGDLTCIRTYDPVVVFTSIGSRFYFERNHLGNDIQLGNEYRWSMGFGLAVSPKVTLSTRFAAAYIEETEIDDERIPGTIQEPMSIRFAATIAQCNRWFEPFVEFGTNDDSNATVFGVIYTY